MRRFLVLPFIVLTLACNLVTAPPPTLTIATLRAQATALPSLTPPPGPSAGAPTPSLIPADEPTGKIAYTCQLDGDQICIINADGTGFRQLTSDAHRRWYASMAPDGASVIYSGFAEDNIYEIYELNLTSGLVTQLTDQLGVLLAPEISPDGSLVVFTRGDAQGASQIWLMERGGANPRQIHARGWDATWSPDGSQILFASDAEGAKNLYVMNRDGSNARRVTDFDSLRGRSDWSPDGAWMVTYNGQPWKREVFIFRPDFSELRRLTPEGGNSQGPSFSPDGKWVAFTSYFDNYGEDLGCEIYIIRIDGTDLRRLTENDYCDYQPRWGQ